MAAGELEELDNTPIQRKFFDKKDDGSYEYGYIDVREPIGILRQAYKMLDPDHPEGKLYRNAIALAVGWLSGSITRTGSMQSSDLKALGDQNTKQL